MKVCIKCREVKKPDAFARRGIGYRGECKTCHNVRSAAWAKSHPERRRESTHKHYAKTQGKHPEACRKPIATPEKKREQRRADYVRHKDRYLARAKKHATENADEVAEYQRQWRTKNAERKAAGDRRWRQANAHRIILHSNKRAQRKREAAPKWLTAIQRAQMQEFYEIASALTCQTGIVHHVDHIHPLKGENFCGLHVPWNLQVLTAVENQRKSSRLWVGA